MASGDSMPHSAHRRGEDASGEERQKYRVIDMAGDRRGKGRYLMDYSRRYQPAYDVTERARCHVEHVCGGRMRGERRMLEVGIKGHQEMTVTDEFTAKAMGSGVMDVFATPAMLALMEKTAFTSVADYLSPGCGTVGTKVDIEHVASSPVGMKITCDSELTAVEGRKLIFRVEAYDEKGLIGRGTHERFLVESQKFQEKTDRKME